MIQIDKVPPRLLGSFRPYSWWLECVKQFSAKKRGDIPFFFFRVTGILPLRDWMAKRCWTKFESCNKNEENDTGLANEWMDKYFGKETKVMRNEDLARSEWNSRVDHPRRLKRGSDWRNGKTHCGFDCYKMKAVVRRFKKIWGNRF